MICCLSHVFQTQPYGMLKETTKKLSGNDRYEGFAIDLIQELSEILGFNYTFVVQEDGANGQYNKETGEWDGMIEKVMKGVSTVFLFLHVVQ